MEDSAVGIQKRYRTTMRGERGFTLVEMLIVVIMTTILSITVFSMGYQYLKQAANLTAKSNFFGERLNVSDFLRQNIGLSTGLINQNSINDPNALVVDPSPASAQIWKLMHAVPGNYGTATSITPVMYYTQDALRADGTSIMNGVDAYQNDFVIYHHGPSSELRVRSLAHPAAGSQNVTKTTCTTQTSACNKDRVLITGVVAVELRFYSRAGDSIDYRSSCEPAIYSCGTVRVCDPAFPTSGNASICNGPPTCQQSVPYGGCNGIDMSQVEVAQFKIKVRKKIETDANKYINNSTIIRIALRNA